MVPHAPPSHTYTHMQEVHRAILPLTAASHVSMEVHGTHQLDIWGDDQWVNRWLASIRNHVKPWTELVTCNPSHLEVETEGRLRAPGLVGDSAAV